MQTIDQIQDDIIDEFAFLGDWMHKYEHIIDLGKSLPPIEEQYKDEDHLVRGCQSRVWLHAADKDGRVVYTADSDAVITKGIIALLIRVLSGQRAVDIVNADLTFIEKIGLHNHLSPTRSNGLQSMLKQMKHYATALQIKSQRNG